VDKLMTHDVCGPGTFGIFQKEFGMNAQVRRGAARARVLACAVRCVLGAGCWAAPAAPRISLAAV